MHLEHPKEDIPHLRSLLFLHNKTVPGVLGLVLGSLGWSGCLGLLGKKKGTLIIWRIDIVPATPVN